MLYLHTSLYIIILQALYTGDILFTMYYCIHKIMFITLYEQFKQFFSYSFDYIQYLPDVLILEMNHQVSFYSTAIPTTQMG